jgi:hypothetical protein
VLDPERPASAPFDSNREINPERTPADVLNRNFVELQNRWSASLAMSTDGSFPSRPPVSNLGKLD